MPLMQRFTSQKQGDVTGLKLETAPRFPLPKHKRTFYIPAIARVEREMQGELILQNPGTEPACQGKLDFLFQ